MKAPGHDLAPDLYRLATDAAASSDSDVLYDGFLGVFSCMVTSDRSHLDSLLARAGTDAADIERRRALREVQKRCEGILNNDLSANRELLQRLARKFRELPNFDAEYWPGLTAGAPTDSQIAHSFERGNVDAFSGAMSDLLPRLLVREGIAPRTHDADLWGIGWMEAVCDLGRSCGPDGFSYLSECAIGGTCPGSMDAFFRIGVTDEDASRIQTHRQAIAVAFKSKDWKFFGLAP